MSIGANLKQFLVHGIVAASLLLGLMGCNQADLLQKFASPADQALAKSYIDLLRQRRIDEIEKAADPIIAGETLHGTLIKMADLIPLGEPTSVSLVGAHRMNTAESSTVNLTFEYDFSGKWIVTNVAVKTQGGNTTVVGFSVIPQPASLEEQNKFTLGGKTLLQHLVLALAVIWPLLTLFTLIICIRTKLKGRKWPWVLFVIFGFGKLAMNWTTGQWDFSPLSFQLFSASAFAPLYGPWTLGVSVPLGAVFFLLLRKRLRAPA